MATSTPTKTPALSIKLTQQALNLLRQIVSAVGWAKTIQDIYIGGQLLAEGGLPDLDPIDWVKTPKQIGAMSAKQQEAYIKKDNDWGSKIIELSLTAKQIEVIQKAFETTLEKNDLGPNKYFNEIIEALGIKIE